MRLLTEIKKKLKEVWVDGVRTANEEWTPDLFLEREAKEIVDLTRKERDKDWIKYLMRRGLMMKIPPTDYDASKDTDALNILAQVKADTRKEEMAYFHGQLKHYLDTVPRENMWDEISGFVMSLEGELKQLGSKGE